MRTYRVAFASIHVRGLADSEDVLFADALRESWTPGAEATRYRRTWRVSAPHDAGDQRYGGRIGFVREGEISTLQWDDDAKDFRRGVATSGVVVPFVVDVPERRVAFQLESGQVRATSFTGAFEAILNESSDTYSWSANPLVDEMPFDEWVNQVDVVTEFNFRLERPNPNYADNERVEHLLENLRLSMARIKGKGENVNTDDPQFEDYMDHVRRNYGRAVLRGRERSGEVSEWRSTGGGTVPAVRPVESEDEEEIPEEELVRSLDAIGDAVEAQDERAEDDDDDEA